MPTPEERADEEVFRENIGTATKLLDRAKEVQSSTVEYNLQAIGILIGQVAIELHEINKKLRLSKTEVKEEEK